MMPSKNAMTATLRAEECTEAQFSPLPEPASSPSEPRWPHNQSRKHSRYRVELDVSLGSDHNFYMGFVENMSLGGVFIATHMLKTVGEIVELNIRLPDSPVAVKGVGRVRWIREFSERSNVPPGMGVQFLQLEPGSLELIEAFLAQREPIFYDD